MINDEFYKRRFVIAAIAIAIVAVFIVRLVFLQLVEDHSSAADSNAMYRQTVFPERGLIYDRNGKLLVFNQPVYEITLIMKDMKQGFDTLAFCELFQMDKETFDTRITDIKNRNKNRGYSPTTPQVFMSNLTKEEIAPFQEIMWKFNGADARRRTIRDYNYSSAAQVLGSVGEVSLEDIKRDSFYIPGDYAGRDGIEKTYEEVLRGKKGVNVFMRDSRGQIQGSYKNGILDQRAVGGQDLTLTLDIELQMFAEDLLQGKLGSVVAIEPQTGEILAIASNPTWNPKLLNGRERSKNYPELLNDPNLPLLNRPTQALYSPGSTFKTVLACIFLEDGIITTKTKYPCHGRQSERVPCTHSHTSPVDVYMAIEQSCNPYFWQAFRDYLEKDGYGKKHANFRARYELWRNKVMQFGLGQPFVDSDIFNPKFGSIPSLESYDKQHKSPTAWRAQAISSLSIGQGEILATPLQICNVAAIIANNGYYITPHLCKNDTMLTHRHETGFDAQYFRIIKDGMRRTMTSGTGKASNVAGLNMAGKTGTIQVHGNKADHSAFIGIAPVDNPKIAVAVLIENGGFGSKLAAPIGSLVIEKYLTDSITRPNKYKEIKDTIINPTVIDRR